MRLAQFAPSLLSCLWPTALDWDSLNGIESQKFDMSLTQAMYMFFVHFLLTNTIFMLLWLSGVELTQTGAMCNWPVRWEVDFTVLHFYFLILLRTNWSFIHVDIRAGNASNCPSSNIIGCGNIPAFLPPSSSLIKHPLKRNRCQILGSAEDCITHNKLQWITVRLFSKACRSMAL